MGFKNYMSRNPIRLATSPSKFDSEFFMASPNLFISIIELVDNLILSSLGNHKRAPRQLIKKLAENQRTLRSQSKPQILFTQSQPFISGQETRNYKNCLRRKSIQTQTKNSFDSIIIIPQTINSKEIHGKTYEETM